MSDGITDAYRQHNIAEREDAMYKASIKMVCQPSEKNLQKVIECCDEFAKVPPSHGINPSQIANEEKKYFEARYSDDNFEIKKDDVTRFIARFPARFRQQVQSDITVTGK